jgi:glycerophosphoryl diester phosphodiesterase
VSPRRGSRPQVLAHRGASSYEYQNSLAAFRRAVALGADGVELDIHACLDGALLVHHDAEVPGIGGIPELPSAAFADYRLPNGEPIPTLAQALEVLASFAVWIELKTLPARWDAALLGAIAESPTPSLCAVHSFDHRIIARMGARQPALRRGVLLASYLLDTPAALRAAGASALWQEAHLIDAELVESVHAAGCTVVAWTVDDATVAGRLTRLGVDALCTNYPDTIRNAAEASA